MWQFFVLIAVLCCLPLPSSAFWWPKATTETPRAQVLQQIPLTYFRTYTYQPLAGETFGVPLFGFGAAQTPLLSGRHYDPYAVTSYAAARRHDAATTGHKGDVTPPAMGSGGSGSGGSGNGGSSNNLLPSTTPAPATTTTTTTTTSTTTPPPPPPPPTTTTTTTTTTSTTSAPPTTSTTEAVASTSSSSSAMRYAEYPAYTRRVSNLYNARPQYPYPDYFNYQPPSSLAEKSGSRIQFVPCMCPVSMPSMSTLSTLSLNSAASTERDRPLSSVVPLPPAAAAAVTEDAANVNLQARHIETEDSELEDETDAEIDLDDEADADPTAVAPLVEDAAIAAVAVDGKVAFESHTTPTVDSNSLV